ncbi:hypothetical protein R9C00_08330 [Flammeovirgaceae bacterium SG7u.111]|nr:hypothetical protein [Flammeovirgaceae bacterium SG7u.132]WPO37453.1 hypothetical protein R9C00_08330 [Flammeovirgaceae bacterium SG7u.111]
MKNNIIKTALILALPILLSSCFGQHNNAPNEGVNLDSERIYGVKGGEPRQLQLTYPDDDGTQAMRAIKIREKLYPR